MELALSLALYLTALTLILHALLLLSPKLAESFRKGVFLDFWVISFVWGPPIFLGFYSGLNAALFCLGLQTLYLVLYSSAHSLFHLIKNRHKGGRLLKSLSKSLGQTRVILGFFTTLLALPVFVVIRIGQFTVYPLLQLVLDFPAYKHSEWIQISRHKFQGLVGLDLLWCLYCEWAAGVYALGGEMVRNNESFWCPIRFYENKHCENCKIEFPDLKEWVPADGKMEEVESLLEKKYPPGKSPRAWYQHPSRSEPKQ